MENKCWTCQFNGEEFDGDVEQHYDGTCSGSGQFVGICNKGQDKHYKENGVNCKKHKVITTKCMGCNNIVPITELKDGFHSDECKNNYINSVKETVNKEEKRLLEINNKIKELKGLENVDEIELMNLQWDLRVTEDCIEEGKDILKAYGIAV